MSPQPELADTIASPTVAPKDIHTYHKHLLSLLFLSRGGRGLTAGPNVAVNPS